MNGVHPETNSAIDRGQDKVCFDLADVRRSAIHFSAEVPPENAKVGIEEVEYGDSEDSTRKLARRRDPRTVAFGEAQSQHDDMLEEPLRLQSENLQSAKHEVTQTTADLESIQRAVPCAESLAPSHVVVEDGLFWEHGDEGGESPAELDLPQMVIPEITSTLHDQGSLLSEQLELSDEEPGHGNITLTVAEMFGRGQLARLEANIEELRLGGVCGPESLKAVADRAKADSSKTRIETRKRLESAIADEKLHEPPTNSTGSDLANWGTTSVETESLPVSRADDADFMKEPDRLPILSRTWGQDGNGVNNLLLRQLTAEKARADMAEHARDVALASAKLADTVLADFGLQHAVVTPLGGSSADEASPNMSEHRLIRIQNERAARQRITPQSQRAPGHPRVQKNNDKSEKLSGHWEPEVSGGLESRPASQESSLSPVIRSCRISPVLPSRISPVLPSRSAMSVNGAPPSTPELQRRPLTSLYPVLK
eukprot:gnl/MRDRNA2_/MRDRNA2_26621_c0_seq2.p1 gnl/MRDRNA2_/MRDRNA2_26621_c0~~gnl/MRDRNA2_/MRDRNA2_26621_c0_seq2.p1  ORF type:complete len:543 (+),score=113.17 gnl/MRDRNA2_/MRDRNA2_26621_c0_seq2:181-1629(+)